MKIVYVLPISWGGIPHYAAECANSVAKYADVTVIKPKDSNDRLFSSDVHLLTAFKPITLRKGYEQNAFSISNLLNLFSYRNIKLINELNPDVVHFPGSYIHAAFFAKLYRLNSKYPIVVTYHSVADRYLTSYQNRGLFAALLWNLNHLSKRLLRPDGIIVHTVDNKNALVAEGESEDKITVISIGAFNFFKKYLKKESYADAAADSTFLYFGYILENKGIDYLIKATLIAANKIIDIKLIIAGEGDLSKYSDRISKNRHIEIHNEFISNEKVAELFQRSEFVVLPYTYHQGHSGVLATAFAFGKPAIVTNIGDLPNLVGDAGLVVTARDEEALAEAIILLSKDKELIRKLSRNAHIKAKELSWDTIAKKHLEVYNKAIFNTA